MSSDKMPQSDVTDNVEITRHDKPSARLDNRVYSELLDAIRFGRYALGERLPSEHELARAHNVSRPVIRIALSRLREDGLIISKQGSGSFVSSGVQGETSGYGPLASVTDIGAYFQFRYYLESQTARWAARYVQSDDIDSLRDLINAMEEYGGLDNGGIDPDFQFHAKIAELSNNRFFASSMNMLRSHMIYVGRFSRSLKKTTSITGASPAQREHIAIVDAIEAHDEDEAARAMILHIEGSERRVFKGE